jgi:eukaryotic-like serine/threonine-protein kinase
MRRTLEQLQAELAGRYTVVRELGRGGMATVYLAEDAVAGGQVAIRVLRREITGLFGSGRFNREIRILQRLMHPAIVPVLDTFESTSLHYYVMPHVTGDSLRVLLERDGPLPLSRVLHVTGAVAGALDYAHSENVLHRDIKPGNILLEDDRVLVCDFGVARAVEVAAGDTISSSGLVLGTPAYMSPEQAMGAPLDERTDVYGLGCVIYEMLAGEPAFAGATSQAVVARLMSEDPRSLRAVRSDVPEHIEAALRAALAKDRDARPSSAAALLSMLTGRAEPPRTQ